VLLVSFVGFGFFQYRAKRLAGKNISKTIYSASSRMLNLALSIIYLAGMYHYACCAVGCRCGSGVYREAPATACCLAPMNTPTRLFIRTKLDKFC